MNSIFKAFQRLNRCDWYVFFWCIYQMQEILYPPGPINQGIQVLIMGWAVYEAGVYMLPQRSLPIMLKATSLLMFMYIVYGSVFIILAPDFYSRHSAYLKTFVNSFLPFFLFYLYSKEGYLDEKRIRIYFLIFLCMIIPQYFHYEAKALKELKMQGKTRMETTNNMGYYFLSLFPMLLFWYKNRIIQYTALCIILLFVFMGMKRGAIGIVGICTVWFLWINVKNATDKKHKYQTIAYGSAMVLIAVVAVVYQLTTSEYFQKRLEDTKDGNASGRDVIYLKLIDIIINDDSYIHLLIGRGAFSTIKEIHVAAHNDWLQTACDIGFLGIIIMCIFFYAFYKTAKDGKIVIKPEYNNCMMMLFFASFAKTFFSMSLQDMPIYATMPMAYLTYHTYNKADSFRIRTT